MHLRPKTTRRLLILGVATAVLFGVAATAWTINTRKTAQRVANARADAMAAFGRGDHAAALPHFSAYLTASKTAEKPPGEADAEALLAYGKSRQAVPMARGRHLIEAIKIFERYLQLKPGDREAQHLLLALYPVVRYNEEALALAKTVLEADPNDPDALRSRVVALWNKRKNDEALATAEQLVKLLPNDLDAHAQVQSLTMRLARDSDAERQQAALVARYEGLLRAHPDDPRFELLLARAHHFAGDGERTVQWLTTAARRNITDPKTAAVLTSLLEQYNKFDESNRVLEQLASAGREDALHVRPLVSRLWQSGRPNDVLKRTDDQDPASPLSDTDLLAYRALALYDLNRPRDAAPIVNALAARKEDVAAVAWAAALRARDNENLAPRERAKQYLEAIERAPDNEVIYFFLGEAYMALGESEPAIKAWAHAARLAQSWSAPAAAISRTLAETGRSAEARSAAREALRRSPKSVSAITGYVVALFAEQQQNPDPEVQKTLLGYVEQIQSQIPREPETLHIYAALLSRTGQRDRAAAVVKSALAGEADAPPPPRDTLLALAMVSFAEKLGLEGQVLDFAERAHGLTPPVAIRKAVLLSQAGKPKEGLKLLESARKTDTKSDPVLWSLAVLQYRDTIGDETARPEWVRLGDANPDNARVQSAILRSPARFADKAFWLRSIDRLKRLTGDEAVTPRIERARWLLAGEPTGPETSDAIGLLRDVDATSLPEIHRLLGIALEKGAAHAGREDLRDGLLQEAAAELELALGARNADADVAADLTRVYRAMGRHSEADKVMSRVADGAADKGVDARKRTARALVGQGQLKLAIGVLEPMGDGQDAGRDALLGGLYRRTGENAKAAALYRKLLADERTEPQTIADAADFFATTGDAATAETFLGRLRAMEAPAGARALLLARHADRHGSAAEALKGYEDAVAADPVHPASWQGLVGYHLRRLQFAEAIAAADRGLKAIPNEQNLQSLRARALGLQVYQKDANLEALAAELSNDPQSGAVTDMMKIVSEAKRNNEPLEQRVAKLRELADRHPDLLRLQILVAQDYLTLRQFDQAEQVANRAMLRLPNEPDAARLLTGVYAARPGREKWAKVLEAARQWRQRSLDNPLDADLAIARTLLEMNRPADAARQIEPHARAGDKPKPKASPVVVEVYARALVRAGETKQAAALLSPLAKADAAWRRVWLQLGATAFGRGEEASRWVEQVVPMLSSADAGEQAALADTWIAIGARLSSPAAFEKAAAVIKPLTSDAKAGATGWRLMAKLSELTGNAEQAVTAYRKLHDAQPDDAEAQNNLAFALLDRAQPGDLPAARTLAESAVAKAPANSSYLDTLARVHLKAGDLPAAEQTFQRALTAESGSVEAMIGLADVHAQSRRPEKARELLVRINDALPMGVQLPVSLQRQLDHVRQSVDAPLQSGRTE